MNYPEPVKLKAMFTDEYRIIEDARKFSQEVFTNEYYRSLMNELLSIKYLTPENIIEILNPKKEVDININVHGKLNTF